MRVNVLQRHWETLGDLGVYGNAMPKFSVSVNKALFCPIIMVRSEHGIKCAPWLWGYAEGMPQPYLTEQNFSLWDVLACFTCTYLHARLCKNGER